MSAREKFSDEDKAELRQGFADSLAAYEAERDQRQNQPAPQPLNPRAAALRDAFLITGDMHELGFAVAAHANETGEADVIAAVKAVRKATAALGDLLAKKQRGDA